MIKQNLAMTKKHLLAMAIKQTLAMTKFYFTITPKCTNLAYLPSLISLAYSLDFAFGIDFVAGIARTS